MTPPLLQVIVCQPLPALAVCGVQDATGTLVVMVGVQMVAVQLLPEVAAAAVQEETKVGPVVIGVGQVKVV